MSPDPTLDLPGNRYRILSILAEGRGSVVCKVLNVPLAREEVAKVVRDAGLPESERRAFDREVRIAKDVGGEPNLPRVWEAGPHTGGPFAYILMELGGDPLDVAACSPARALALAVELASAVASVHRRGYLHNAVCPDNILVRNYAELRLIDFGAACRRDEADAMPPLLEAEGSPYTAPERRAGAPPSVASDIYSVGAVLHACLTSGVPRGRDARGGELGDAVAGVARNAMAVDPAARHATAEQLREELERLRDRLGAEDTTTVVVERRRDGEAAGAVSLHPPRPVLDFGDVGPDGAAAVRTFEVRSTAEAGGAIEASAPWLDVCPGSFSQGVTEITVRLAPQHLPQGRQSEAQVHVRPPGRGRELRVDCRARHTGGVDLVLILDTVGDAERLRARCEFARGVLEAALPVLGELGELRVGVLAYGDYGLEGDPIHPPGSVPLQRHDLALPDEGIEALAGLRPTRNRDFEAALEDAAAALGKLAWRPLSSHALVSIGNRPPHPPRTGPFQQVASPSGHDWQPLLADARRRLRLKGVSVVDPVTWPATSVPAHALGYMEGFWRELGNVARLDYERTTPAEVVRLLAGSIRPGGL